MINNTREEDEAEEKDNHCHTYTAETSLIPLASGEYAVNDNPHLKTLKHLVKHSTAYMIGCQGKQQRLFSWSNASKLYKKAPLNLLKSDAKPDKSSNADHGRSTVPTLCNLTTAQLGNTRFKDACRIFVTLVLLVEYVFQTE